MIVRATGIDFTNHYFAVNRPNHNKIMHFFKFIILKF